MAQEFPRRRIDDPEVLKALTHPLRQQLYRLLAQLGPSTVGALAEKVDADPGRVSYHLRELAKRGFIEEAPELARDRRETWWRPVPSSTSWSKEDFEAPEARAIFDTLFAQTLADQIERLRRFTETVDDWDEEWQAVSVANESYLFLTAEEAGELVDQLRDLFERWGEVSGVARDSGDTEGREAVFAFLHMFPERP